jgi:hypothetical protein
MGKVGMSWNSKGEMIYQGQTYPQTSIADLIKDALVGYKHFSPVGVYTFYNILSLNDMPLSLVGSMARQKLMASSHSEPSTAFVGKKSNKGKKWTVFQ